jgi:hypothetical protein
VSDSVESTIQLQAQVIDSLIGQPQPMRWQLKVVFDTPANQVDNDQPDLEERMFMRYLWDNWGGLPEENREDIHRNGSTVIADCDMIEPLVDAMRWVGMNTIPVMVSLTRQGSRS